MKRLSNISIFACLVAGAMLVHPASFSGKALAGESGERQTTETDTKVDRLPMANEAGAAATAPGKTGGPSTSKKTGDAAETKAAATKSKPNAAAGKAGETVEAQEASSIDVLAAKASGASGQTDDL